MTTSDDEHSAKTVRYDRRNRDGAWAAVALAACVVIVLVVLYVFVAFGIE